MSKNIKTKKCERTHVDILPTHPVTGFTYRNIDGNIFISAFSVFKMFQDLGLKEQSLSFISTVAKVYLEKK